MGTEAVLIASAIIGAGSAKYQGDKAEAAQDKGLRQSKRMQEDKKREAGMLLNKENKRSVKVDPLLASNMMASKTGNAGTMLTGPAGVSSSSLTLGRQTLLGGANG